MHEGERRGRGKGVAARVGAAEIAAMGKGSAQEGRPPSHRNGFSSRSGVPHGLFSVKSTSCSSLQNAHASGSLRSPYGYLRTVTSLRNVPVLRMAYFTISHHRPCGRWCSARLIRQVETLELQPLRGLQIPHRPTFGAPVFRSAYSASRNARALAAFAASIKPHGGLIFETLMLQVRCAHPTPSHRNAPSGHSGVPVGLFYAKSTQYSLLQNARPSGSLRSPCGYRGVEDSSPSVPCGCRNVREGDAAENGGEERRKVIEIMTCL